MPVQLDAQFMHEEGYPLTPSKPGPTRPRKRSTGKPQAINILSEALRVPNFCKHVQNPQPPRTLCGIGDQELMQWWKKTIVPGAMSTMTPVKGGFRRQRVDTPVLLAAVASYPCKPDDSDPHYVVWRSRVVTWAQTHYGQHLVSVLEHIDEEYGHVHILSANRGRSVKPLMAGHAAAKAEKDRGGDEAAQGAAYVKGCQRLQDEFHEAVGAPCGLARLSPAPRPRLPRLQHLRQREAIVAAREDTLAAAEAALKDQNALGAERDIVRRAKEAKALEMLTEIQAREQVMQHRFRRVREFAAGVRARLHEVRLREGQVERQFMALREFAKQRGFDEKVNAVLRRLKQLASRSPGREDRALNGDVVRTDPAPEKRCP